MRYKRWFRVLVCLVLVCSLVINISPVRAKATSIAAAGITIEGLFAIAYAIAGGMVFADLTVDAINAVGTDLDDNITVTVDTDTISKWQRLKEYGKKIQPDPDQDPGEWHSLLKECLAGGLLSAISAWLVSYVNAAKTGANISEGYAAYNGKVLPELPEFSCFDSTPYIVMSGSESDAVIYCSSEPLYVMTDSSSGTQFLIYDTALHLERYGCADSADSWTQQSCNDLDVSGYSYYNDVLLPNPPYNMTTYFDRCSLIYRSADTYYWLMASYSSNAYYFQTDGKVYTNVGVTRYVFEDGAWVKTTGLSSGEFVSEYEDFIWSNKSGGFKYSSTSYDKKVADVVSSDINIVDGGYPLPDIFWCNSDLMSYISGDIYFPGTSAVLSKGVTLPVLPSIYVGDLPDQIENGEKDESNLELPIIDPFGYVQSGETALEDIKSIEQQLYDGDITYEEYLEEVIVQDEPEEETTPSTKPSEEPDDETTPSEDPVDDSTISDYTLNLTEFFPFCIPFDIYEFVSLLAAEPEAPVFEWAIQVPQLDQTFEVKLDLTPWNGVAALFRKLELLAFIIGLGYVTREKFLRG